MVRATLIAILAATLAAFGGLAAACGDGGGDTLTLEEYFTRFEEIDMNVDQEIEALFVDFPDEEDADFFANEDNLPLVKDLFAGFPRVLGDALDDLRDVNPPSEVESEHNAFVDAGDELVTAFEDASGQVQDADTMAEVDVINTSAEQEMMPLQDRFDSLCLDIVAVGIDNGITVDVSCVDQ